MRTDLVVRIAIFMLSVRVVPVRLVCRFVTFMIDGGGGAAKCAIELNIDRIVLTDNHVGQQWSSFVGDILRMHSPHLSYIIDNTLGYSSIL